MGANREWEVQDLVAGAWEGKVDKHSCVFELRTITGLCEQKGEEWSGKRVHVCTDNVGAAFIAGKGCMKSSELHALALRLCSVSLKWGVAISTQYLAGDGIIVAGADGLSRLEDDYNCTLKLGVFKALWDWKGPFDVDCCCSPQAIMCNPYTARELDCVSPFLKESLHRSVLTFVHPGRLYAFPPAPIIGPLIAHIQKEVLKMVIVVPEWPTQPWYAAVHDQDVLRLGQVGELTNMGGAGLGHPFGRCFEREWRSVEMLAVAFNM
jgi:hypothetical protein